MATAESGNGKVVPKQINVLAQYVKDFSFENPNAPRSLGTQTESPPLQLSVNVNGQPLSNTDFEVELKFEGAAGTGPATLFRFELVYGSVLRLGGFTPEEVHPVVFIEGPRLMFPFARAIIADAVRNGGFPPLMIDPIDFLGLYQQRLTQMAQAESANQKPA